jgi:IMP dehydrogenase/GMP reductase
VLRICAAPGLPFTTATADAYAAMKFHIEITRDNGIGTKVIYRTIVDEMSPERAKTKAGALIDLYSGRGANGARVLDQKNKELFRL